MCVCVCMTVCGCHANVVEPVWWLHMHLSLDREDDSHIHQEFTGVNTSGYRHSHEQLWVSGSLSIVRFIAANIKHK